MIADQIIEGITGSAIDGDEAAPGPIMLQGEERRVEFRNLTIRVPRADDSRATSPSRTLDDRSAAAHRP